MIGNVGWMLFALCKLAFLLSSLDIPKGELDLIFTKYDLRRLDLYSRNLVDYHLIMDLLPEGKKTF